MSKIDKLLNNARKAILELNNATEDANNPFATSTVISKRKNLQAKAIEGSFFKSDYVDIEENVIHPIVNYALEYRLYNGANIPLRYWREINYYVEWFIGKIPIDCEAEQWFELDMFMREALLFDDACLFTIKGDPLYYAGVVNKTTNTVVGRVSFVQRDGFYNENNNLNRKQLGNVDLNNVDKVLPFNAFYEGIGMYVKCLDILQIYLIFLTNKWKSISFLNIIPDTTRCGSQIVKWLSHPEITSFRDKSYDPNSREAITQNDANGKTISWYVPEMVKEVYDTLNFEIDKVYSILNKRFGKPSQAVDKTQTLTAEANIEQEDSEGALKYLIKRFVKFFEKYNIIKSNEKINSRQTTGSCESDQSKPEVDAQESETNKPDEKISNSIQSNDGEVGENENKETSNDQENRSIEGENIEPKETMNNVVNTPFEIKQNENVEKIVEEILDGQKEGVDQTGNDNASENDGDGYKDKQEGEKI